MIQKVLRSALQHLKPRQEPIGYIGAGVLAVFLGVQYAAGVPVDSAIAENLVEIAVGGLVTLLGRSNVTAPASLDIDGSEFVDHDE